MKPGILFSPGAFHPAACFDEAKARLSASGFEPVLVTTHPSLGAQNGHKTLVDDTEAVRSLLGPHVGAGREFVLVAHSYGGFPAWGATEGWTVAERAATGERGGVLAVVLVGASVPLSPGAFPLGIFGGSRDGIVYPGFFDPGPPGGGQIARPNEASKGSFYSDMSEKEADRYACLLLPQSRDAFETTVSYTISDPVIPVYYMICEQDRTIPPAGQERVAAAIKGCKILRINSGHCCFISQVDHFVALIDEVCKTLGGS